MRSPETGLERLRAATGAAADDPRLLAVRLDLEDAESIAAAATAVQQRIGAPDVLVHNAGIAAAGTVEDVPISVWERIFSTNLFGPVALTKALLPSMRAAGRGRIVVLSSAGGIAGMPSVAAYSAAKGAIVSLTKGLAKELAPHGIRVNCVAPGLIGETAFHGRFTPPAAFEAATKGVLLGRAGTPEEVATVVAFLASADSSFLTGETIEINGGMNMR